MHPSWHAATLFLDATPMVHFHQLVGAMILVADMSSFRRLARPRGARRPPGGFHPAGATSASIQQSFPPFGQTNGAQQTSSMFRPSTNLNPQLSQSFPQSNNASNNDNTNNTGSNNSFTAPAGSFSFSTVPSQNPFATSNQNETTPVKGFHGSIFNFDTPAPPAPPAERASGNTNPLFAPGAPDLSKNVFEQPKPATNGFTWPSVTQQAQASGSVFSAPSVQQQQTPSLFTNSTEKPSSTTSNIFGGFNAPASQESSKPQPDIFERLTGAPPPASEAQGPSNPFAAFTPQTQADVKTNPFSSITGASSQTASNPFASMSSNKAQPSANPFAHDSMQTSPDNTPAKASEPLFKPFVFTPQTSEKGATSPTKGSSVSQNGNLFGQSVQAEGTVAPATDGASSKTSTPFNFASQAAASVSDNQPNAQEVPAAGRSLFDRITTTDESVTAASDTFSLPAPKTQAVSNGLFAQIADPKPVVAAAQQPSTTGTQGFFTPQNSTDTTATLLAGHTSKLFQPAETTKHESSPKRPQMFPTPAKTADVDQSPSKLGGFQPSQPSTSGTNTIDASTVPEPPSSFTAGERQQVFIGWRLRQLDAGIEASLVDSPELDLLRINRYHNLKRKMIEEAGAGTLRSLVSSKKSKDNGHPNLTPSTQQGPPGATQQNKSLSPEKAFQSPAFTSSKRKADGEITEDNMGLGIDRVKRSRGVDASPKSQTSNIFSSIVASNKTQNASSDSVSNYSAPKPANDGVSPFKPSSGENSGSKLFSTVGLNTASAFGGLGSGQASPGDGAKTLSNPFAKPAVSPTTDSSSTEAVKPPVFNANPTNFMAQFGAAAKRYEDEQKKKRKAEDYDSDEDNEEDWEKKDAEQQRLKRQKISEAAKSAQSFVPTSITEPASPPKQKPTSIFDQIHPAFGANNTHNIFGHLNKTHASAETAEVDSASDEDDHDQGEAGAKADSVHSLGDRVSRPDTFEAKEGNTARADTSADHTWKADSPIKFTSNGSTTSAPTINITSASSSKPPATALFGAASAAIANPARPATSLFANLASSTASGSAVGFGFAPAKGATANLAQPSSNTSRATSPGATTGESATESANETVEDSIPKQDQLDLMSQRPGEENEDVLFEAARVKAWKYIPGKSAHEAQGVGPLRVLKNRETGKRRVIVRQDPNNAIIINSGFVKDGKYDFIGKSRVRCFFADRGGSLCAWQIQTKDEKVSKEMAKIFIESKEDEA